MGKIYNHARYKPRRRALRCSQTGTEKALWQKLRNRSFFGIKFFRQFSVGSYILDFYSPSLKLAIEVDGGQHMDEERKDYDTLRRDYLEGMGIDVLRFWNSEVLQNIDGVMQRIYGKLKEKGYLIDRDNSP